MISWCVLVIIISVWKVTHQSPSNIADVAKFVTIKSKHSGLVFDGNTKFVKAEKPDNSIGQKWILEATPKGSFIIKNARDDGYVLDVQGGCQETINIILYGRHSYYANNQLYYIHSDGTIGSACGEQFILKMENGTVQMNNIDETCEMKDTVYQIENTN